MAAGQVLKRAASTTMPMNEVPNLGLDPTGSVTDKDEWADYIAGLQAQRAAIKPSGYSAQETARRKQENADQYALGLAAMLSGNEAFQNMGGSVLKQALGNREERVTDKGTYEPLSGAFTPNAEYQGAKIDAAIEKAQGARAAANEKREAAREQRAYQIFQQQQHDRNMQQMRIAMTEMAKANAAGNSGVMSQFGYSPQGQRVLTNSRSGQQFTIDSGPDGKPIYTPYSGAVTPNATWEKQATEVQKADLSYGVGRSLMADVEKNPESFGFKATALGAMPMSGLITDRFMSSDALNARAGVLQQAAQVVHDLYGAALTQGEAGRARAFVPDQNDSPEMTMIKLRAAMKWAEERGGQFGTGVKGAVAARRSGQDAVPQGGGTPTPKVGGGRWKVEVEE